jgi:hypothetical protein
MIIFRRLNCINPSNAELNPIFHLLALLEAHHILHISSLRVNTAPGIVTLAVRCTGSLATCAPNGHLQKVTIPDAVLIQFKILMMSMLLLEKCRGM